MNKETEAVQALNELAKEPFVWHIESVNVHNGVRWWACLWGDLPDGQTGTYSATRKNMYDAILAAARKFKKATKQ